MHITLYIANPSQLAWTHYIAYIVIHPSWQIQLLTFARISYPPHTRTVHIYRISYIASPGPNWQDTLHCIFNLSIPTGRDYYYIVSLLSTRTGIWHITRVILGWNPLNPAGSSARIYIVYEYVIHPNMVRTHYIGTMGPVLTRAYCACLHCIFATHPNWLCRLHGVMLLIPVCSADYIAHCYPYQ